MKNHTINKGMVLPLVIILSFIILSSLGFWYRRTMVQSFLSERLIAQRIDYTECKSLLPILKIKLDAISSEQLKQANDDFMTVAVSGKKQWQIARSPYSNGRVVFVFTRMQSSHQLIRLSLTYKRRDN
jgi:hypothetical protein